MKLEDLAVKVRKILKKNMWLVLSTVDEKNQPHSSVVVYQNYGNTIICQTGKPTNKVRNISFNNRVSVTIPFRKNFLHKLIPAPPAELHFTTLAEIKPWQDEEAREIFKRYLKYSDKVKTKEENIWIKMTIPKTISTYGVAVSLFKMRNPEKARKIVKLN